MSMKRKLSDCGKDTPKRVKTQSLATSGQRARTCPVTVRLVKRTKSLPYKYELRVIVEDRSKSWRTKEYEEDCVRKIAELRAMRREDEETQAVREEELVKKLRKAMEFKAQPIHRYPALCITRSTKKLTQPQTPPFVPHRPHQH